MSDRPDGRPVPSPRPRVCTSRANTDNGTNDGTNTERAGRHGPPHRDRREVKTPRKHHQVTNAGRG